MLQSSFQLCWLRGWHFFGSALALLASAEAFAADPDSDRTATILFAGDAMLAETTGDAIERGEDPFRHFAEILKTADVRVLNLECAVSTKGAAIKGKRFTFEAHPRVLPVVARHFNVVSLANNHSVDFGREALADELGLLDSQRLAHIGGGRNSAEARAPHLVEVNGLRIALLAYNDFMPRSFEAGPNWPGVAWCVAAQVMADIRAAREIHKADLVIPFMHWGDEHEPANDRQKKIARRMIDAGADVVVGGHPHVTQEAEYYKGKLIAYSLGNFVFDGFVEGPARIGWVMRLRFDKKGLLQWDTVVAHLDEGGNPKPDAEASSPAGDARLGTMVESRAAGGESPYGRTR